MKVSVWSFSASCTSPKPSSVLWHSSPGYVGWNVVCHVGWVSFCHPLQQVNSAEHRADVPSNEQAQGPHFHVLLPAVPRGSWCSAFSQDSSFRAPLLLRPHHQRAPRYTKGPFESKSCFQNPCFSALPLCAVKYLPRKKIHPFVIFLLAIKKNLLSTLRWQFAPGKILILNEVSAYVYWW